MFNILKHKIDLRNLVFLTFALMIFSPICFGHNISVNSKKTVTVWTKEKAAEWYTSQSWISGCNFQPSSAINQIEMWQSDSFDATTIDKELGWAEELGFNTMRVFLSSVVWKNDPVGFKKQIDQYLTISSKT